MKDADFQERRPEKIKQEFSGNSECCGFKYTSSKPRHVLGRCGNRLIKLWL